MNIRSPDATDELNLNLRSPDAFDEVDIGYANENPSPINVNNKVDSSKSVGMTSVDIGSTFEKHSEFDMKPGSGMK